jgi:L-alanine-DL-glutamate epimerase-like enolase superfamily enzyme
MKISALEAVVLRQKVVDSTRADGGQDSLLVKVFSEDGQFGVGEVDSSPEICQAVIDAPASHSITSGLRNLLVGHEVSDVNETWEYLYRGSIYAGRRGAGIHALSGVDMALWDLWGKTICKPVAEMLGTTPRTRIPLYASRLMERTPELVTETVSEARALGFGAIKLGWGPIGESRSLDLALIAAARDAAGSEMALMLDAGYGYGRDVAEATFIASALADHGFQWLEEPFYPDEIEAYAALTNKGILPIAAGEQNATRWEFLELARAGALDIWQPDIARCGGISEVMQIASVANEYGVRVVPHAWKTGILKAASLHANAVLEGERIQEWSTADNPLAQTLVKSVVPIDEGHATVPTSPGLGVELDEEVVERFHVSTSGR